MNSIQHALAYVIAAAAGLGLIYVAIDLGERMTEPAPTTLAHTCPWDGTPLGLDSEMDL